VQRAVRTSALLIICSDLAVRLICRRPCKRQVAGWPISVRSESVPPVRRWSAERGRSIRPFSIPIAPISRHAASPSHLLISADVVSQ
jgi:hypothetical protein